MVLFKAKNSKGYSTLVTTDKTDNYPSTATVMAIEELIELLLANKPIGYDILYSKPLRMTTQFKSFRDRVTNTDMFLHTKLFKEEYGKQIMEYIRDNDFVNACKYSRIYANVIANKAIYDIIDYRLATFKCKTTYSNPKEYIDKILLKDRVKMGSFPVRCRPNISLIRDTVLKLFDIEVLKDKDVDRV